MLLAVRRANGAQSQGTNIVVAAFFDISHDPYECTSDRLWIGLSSYESSASPRTIPSTVVFIIVDLSIDRRIRSSGSNLENKLPSTEARSQADRVVILAKHNPSFDLDLDYNHGPYTCKSRKVKGQLAQKVEWKQADAYRRSRPIAVRCPLTRSVMNTCAARDATKHRTCSLVAGPAPTESRRTRNGPSRVSRVTADTAWKCTSGAPQWRHGACLATIRPSHVHETIRSQSLEGGRQCRVPQRRGNLRETSAGQL